MDADARCDHCKFWAADEPYVDEHYLGEPLNMDFANQIRDLVPVIAGECRKGAPVDDYRWRRTKANQWCGEFKAGHVQAKPKA